jgi:hypothetical protein
MAEDPFWRSIRLTWEDVNSDCPDDHRTVAFVHFAHGDMIEVNHVRPYGDGWVFVQDDHSLERPDANFVRQETIVRVEIRTVPDPAPKRAVGFVVEPMPED